MPASIPIQDDWKVWDWLESITYESRAANDTYPTKIANLKAVREDIHNQPEDDMTSRRTTWHVPQKPLGTLVPKFGDRLKDANAAYWYVERAVQDPSGNFWAVFCVKGV